MRENKRNFGKISVANFNTEINKKGQVTIFIILAIVLVAGIILFFSLRPGSVRSIPEDMRPIYDYYLSCVESESEMGIVLLGEQGGYIELPDFSPGSPYAPFSSQLSFFGQAVPYWMYVSGNNFLKEQIPTKGGMEAQLSGYVEARLDNCDFSDFEKQGYDIFIESPIRDDPAGPSGTVSVRINDLDVDLNLNNRVTIYKGDQSVVIDNHKLKIQSKLGKFYDMALKVYNKEKNTMFLEDYAVDIMRLYAPVDGVEMSCAPKIFVEEQIREDLYEGLDANMNSIKLNGDYYRLSSEDRKYFVTDVGFDVDENVNIMYNTEWPSRIEIYGDKIVKPVGTQPELSALGFCYIPYHLVYDISFPVMIQFYDTENLFQFPISVVIDNNLPREAIPLSYGDVSLESKVCQYKNSGLKVYTYDSELNPVEASLTFKCLGAVCDIGETIIDGSDAVFEGGVSQCVNGFVVATAPGYAPGKTQISTNSENVANILLKKKYELDLTFDRSVENAVVTFSGEDYSATVVYPEITSVELIEGMYNITAYAYEESTLTLEGTSDTMCVDVPVEGIGGFLGLEEEKCYNVDVPSMDIEMAVIGGGKGTDYIAESVLKDSKSLNVEIQLFSRPRSLDDLQENYAQVDTSFVYLEFE